MFYGDVALFDQPLLYFFLKQSGSQSLYVTFFHEKIGFAAI